MPKRKLKEFYETIQSVLCSMKTESEQHVKWNPSVNGPGGGDSCKSYDPMKIKN